MEQNFFRILGPQIATSQVLQSLKDASVGDVCNFNWILDKVIAELWQAEEELEWGDQVAHVMRIV